MPYKDLEKRRETNRKWKLQNPDKVRRWEVQNPERVRETHRKWRQKDGGEKWREDCRRRMAEWRASNPEKVRQTLAKRRATKLQAMPKWADQERIRAIYRKAGELGYDVDHMVPLVSSKVCGLHVESNLQLLPSDENRRKSNRWWPDMFEEASDL